MTAKLRSWWEQIQQHPVAVRRSSWWLKIRQHLFIAIGVIVVLTAFVLAVYKFGWDWTGFNGGYGQIKYRLTRALLSSVDIGFISFRCIGTTGKGVLPISVIRRKDCRGSQYPLAWQQKGACFWKEHNRFWFVCWFERTPGGLGGLIVGEKPNLFASHKKIYLDFSPFSRSVSVVDMYTS